MAHIPLLSVTIVTAVGGAGTGRIVVPQGGRLLGLIYKKATSGSYSDGVGLVATIEQTAQPVVTYANLNADAAIYPRAQLHLVTAGATGLTLDGTRFNVDAIPICAGHTILLTLTAGGDEKSGTFFAQVG